MSRSRVQLILSILLTISLIPALISALQRVQFERNYNTVALVMDYPDVVRQARENGLDEQELLARYKALGVAGVSIYEPSLQRLVQTDRVVYRAGSDWRNERISMNQDVTQIRSNEYYLRSLEPGAAEGFVAKYRYKTRQVTVDGTRWIAFPLDVSALPAGPDQKLIENLQSQGFFIVYRPFNALALANPGNDLPDVPYIVYAGDEVLGNGDETKLENVRKRTTTLLTGVIEATDQQGMEEIAKQNPVVRVFSIRPEWQAKLRPEEVASKFVLAARERNHRLLYLRPFYRISDTEIFLNEIKSGLERASLVYGKPTALEYQPSPLWRQLSLVGPLLALGLLALCFPWQWLGAAAGVVLLLGSTVVGGIGPRGIALLAAIVFPVLGFALARRRGPVAGVVDWVRATAITLMGAFFVAALGASRNEVLALEPFRGVALTLVAPPLILAVIMLPRQDIRKTVRDLWNTPITIGTLVLAMVGVAALFVSADRRGNASSVGISDTEARIREQLQDSMIRPRSREILLHPAAIVGLAGGWPLWFSNLLLLGAVIGQASIVSTFSHFHTPFLISLLRTVNGIALGAVIGLALLPVVYAVRRYIEARSEARSLEVKRA